MTWRFAITTETRMKKKRLDPIHPGEILQEEFMTPLELSANALAAEIGVPVTRVWEILRGRRGVTANTALRLARFFGTTPELWLGLQAEFDLRTARRQVGAQIDEQIEPAREVKPGEYQPVLHTSEVREKRRRYTAARRARFQDRPGKK
jgi:addiction module HigA family antidote